MKESCKKANLSNIEEVMFEVDRFLNSLPERLYFQIEPELNEYLDILNPIYIEKMKVEGKVTPFYLDDILGPSMN
jgi:hypothetical protein